MSENKNRLLSGLILTLLIIFIIKIGGLFLFRLTLSIVAILTLNEFLKIFKINDFLKFWGLGFSFLLPFFVKSYPPYSLLVLFYLLIFCIVILLKEVKVEVLNSMFTFSFGIFYIPFLLTFLMSLRLFAGNTNVSENLVLFLLFVIWAGDTGSLYMGRRFGNTKLAPVISPNKTVAGTFGGLLFNVIAALLCKIFFLSFITGFQVILFSLVIGLTGQVGDLVESYIKRCMKLKDSSSLIPGHGGMLDRIDSLLFAAPIFYYLLKLFQI